MDSDASDSDSSSGSAERVVVSKPKNVKLSLTAVKKASFEAPKTRVKEEEVKETEEEKRAKEKNKQRELQRDWFEIKTPALTQELKEDLRALQLRNYMDPKRFYKANDSKKLPKVFQVGTIIAGAADDRFSRLTRKERKTRFVDEILADQRITSYSKRVFREIASKSEAGGRKDYNKRQKKRQNRYQRR
mmetsp:Transcript_7280/g.8345  ORF Transcript_7280/g.8345 Transcript_7280/m.8345 type:complete len:189 (-) Transcript_7280:139-705(-)